MQIPFVNLKAQYQSIKPDVDDCVQRILDEGQFIGGFSVKEFESQFAKKTGVPYCISTGNGTDALFIILKALNLNAGDEVITPAFSCIPSSEIISLTGATPVFCDVDPVYYTLDASDVERKITSKTKAIIAVHLYGQSAPLEQLKMICDKHQLHLIEDCAQAHLTTHQNGICGSFGVASAFSFYPTKNLGAYGDAGCILTSDSKLEDRMRRFANHGALYKDDHALEGTNSRMDTLQAALLTVKLNHLEKWNARRREIAAQYISFLKDLDQITLPAERQDSVHSFHIFCIKTPFRESLKKYLQNRGVTTHIHYPKGIPFTEAYAHFTHTETEFPVTAILQDEVLSLPIYPELTNDEVAYIADSIRHYFSLPGKS